MLLEVSGQPLFGLVLAFPLYRDVVPAATGPDVKEIQRALRRLNYPVAVTGTFDAASQDALRKLFKARGYTAPTSSASDGQTGGAQTATQQPTAAATAAGQGVTLPKSMVIVLDSGHRRVSGISVKVGTVLADPKATLLELDGEQAGLRVIASRDQTSVLKVGQQAEVVDDTTGASTTAEIVTIGTDPVTDDNGTSGFDVRLKFTGSVPAVTDRTLRVSIAEAETVNEVLAVPVSAVYSRADGSTFVTVVLEKEQTVDVTVKVGKAAGGWTEVVPQGSDVLKAGSTVVVGVKAGASAKATGAG